MAIVAYAVGTIAALLVLGRLSNHLGRRLTAIANTRYETVQWVMWQMGGVGPMFGQVGFLNKFAGKAYEDKRPLDRYSTESTRLLSVLDERLAARDWVMGADYSIAGYFAARLGASSTFTKRASKAVLS
jgi:GSH-dependent disulfide-bond oxidoreductase